MADVKESFQRGLKRGLILVAFIVLAAMALAGYQMLTAPNKQQPGPNPPPPPPKFVKAQDNPLTNEKKIPKEIKVPDDISLSVKEYAKWGCPAPDRPWGIGDMFKARTAFTTNPLLAGEKRPPLPRFESKRSGELFARITSSQNFDRVRDTSIPVKNRLDFATAYATNLASFYELYGNAFIQHEVSDSELVEICGLYLQLAASWKELVDESLRTTPKDTPAYQGFVEGEEKAKKGCAIIVNLGMTTLADTENYRSGERMKLLGYMKKTAPTFASGLTAESRNELLQRVSEMTKNPDQKALHDDLSELHSLIQKAQQPN